MPKWSLAVLLQFLLMFASVKLLLLFVFSPYVGSYKIQRDFNIHSTHWHIIAFKAAVLATLAYIYTYRIKMWCSLFFAVFGFYQLTADGNILPCTVAFKHSSYVLFYLILMHLKNCLL